MLNLNFSVGLEGYFELGFFPLCEYAVLYHLVLHVRIQLCVVLFQFWMCFMLLFFIIVLLRRLN